MCALALHSKAVGGRALRLARANAARLFLWALSCPLTAGVGEEAPLSLLLPAYACFSPSGRHCRRTLWLWRGIRTQAAKQRTADASRVTGGGDTAGACWLCAANMLTAA